MRVATLDGNLYAVGGYDSSSHLATVEKYEPQVNSWTPVASMLSRRSSAGVAVLEGALYVAGGNDGTSCLNSVERYSPKAGAWESVAPMNIRRSTHDLVAMDGWLYAVGATMAAPASTPLRNTTQGPINGWPPPVCSQGAAVWAWQCWSYSTSHHHPHLRCLCPLRASDLPMDHIEALHALSPTEWPLHLLVPG